MELMEKQSYPEGIFSAIFLLLDRNNEVIPARSTIEITIGH